MSLADTLSLAEVHVAALSHLQFTAYVGIDWADTKHDICLQAAGDTDHQFDCIPHQVAALTRGATGLNANAIAEVQARRRLLRSFVRRGLLAANLSSVPARKS
jgi:cell division protein FtsB